MPQMGVSVAEGTITRWLKQLGDTVERDETLLEISTDKVDTEVPSPGAGVVAEIRVQEGETVEVGHGARRDRAGRRGTRGSTERGARAGDARSRLHRRPRNRSPRQKRRLLAEASPEAPAPAAPQPAAPVAAGPGGNGRTFVSPVVARIAAEHGVRSGRHPGHRAGRPRDEEGHPGVHRVRGSHACAGRGSSPPRSRLRPAAPAPQPEAAAEPCSRTRRLLRAPRRTGSGCSAQPLPLRHRSPASRKSR